LRGLRRDAQPGIPTLMSLPNRSKFSMFDFYGLL